MTLRITALVLIVFLNSGICLANFGEMFGASPSTTGIGNQANLNPLDPSNNYYAPAALAWTKAISLNASGATVNMDFESIKNVTTKNSTNSGFDEVGNVNTEYGNYLNGAVHATLPIAVNGAGPLAVSVFTPMGNLIETNSGDPELPEYVMYRSRFRRTVVHLNYAHPLSEEWGFSLGTHIGFQAAADVQTNISLNGATYGSSGAAKSKASPSLGAIISLARRFKEYDTTAYFTFQQEMKSNLTANATGEVNDPASLPLLIEITSMIFYDPYIYRFGMTRSTAAYDLFLSLEYQDWSGYKTPVVRIKNKGGVVQGSNDFEQAQAEGILVPKIGGTYNVNDSFKFLGGFSYRPTPLSGEFSGAGNSIDSDSFITTGGLIYSSKLFGKGIDYSMAAQYHKLKEKTVVKSANEENGSAGSKIGAPGFNVGGTILVGSFGANIAF
ncbi:MAG: hypothetical protein HOM21_13170 [Halobacteriovoraceae bacterium]|jgi:long-subunit fatty acid transport protein|nr:hypothetical protein [Halobacteriovoraceae bacterium]